MTRERRLLAAAGLFAAAAAVRLFRLDHFSYGLDEILQAYWISGDWKFFWKSLTFDAFHPPLDYLLDRLLEPLGPADWARKLPAVLWGLGTIATLGALVARRAGRAAGWITALLLAFAPFHVRYSQELRPYSLALFLLSLSLLSLDRYLEKPTAGRLLALWLAFLATAYALYLAVIVLAMTAAAMLAEESFSADPGRRRAARRFLLWSPAFVGALFVAYIPRWPYAFEATRRAPMSAAVEASWRRWDRILSFFAFAPVDGHLLGRKGLFFVLLVAAGAVLAWTKAGLRFLVAWSVGGLVVIDLLGRLHPHYDVSRRYLPAGLAFPALAALPVAALVSKPRLRSVAATFLALVLFFDLRSLAVYFREGRADWRTLTDYLRRESLPNERVFTENQYSQLCVAYYLVGPRWMFHGGKQGREVLNLDGEVARLTWSWRPGERAWLVVGGPGAPSPDLRRWGERFPPLAFPKAEGSILRRLDAERQGTAFAQ